MKYIKAYNKYLESIEIDYSYQNIDLNESLSIWHQSILNSIGAQLENFKEIFGFDSSDDLENLSENSKFQKKLISLELKHSPLENTDNYETFINKSCRFMMIYDINSTELENPKYILIQSWIESLNKWDDIECYRVNDDIKRFYDKLSSKTIEVISDGVSYIYKTSNGNEWNLSNNVKETNIFKKYLRKEEFENILKSNKVKVNII